AGLLAALGPGMTRLAGHPRYGAIRLAVLAVMTGFVGFWGQGQLSVVPPLATLRTAVEGGSFAYLLYDPFSLVVWAVAGLGFVLWGRGLFCGWLCPFGALQEFAHRLGRALRLPRWEPAARWDDRLKGLKYLLLAGLVATTLVAPDHIDDVAEIEPFKTAITTLFQREWWFVAYALVWLGLGMVTFKGFCRWVCPLGAVMALGALIRGRDWIARRAECGSPCQLCRVRCNYGAIRPRGQIRYSECFQCLDCVTIHDDPRQCVPLVLAALPGWLDLVEREFSLYRADSALCRLNATGHLPGASADFRALMRLSDRLHRATGGLFDPTVGALWQALARGGDAAAARATLGWGRVTLDPPRLAPGQALTFNGIAQGWGADLVRARLADLGFARALVDLGELAALGGPWQVGLDDPAAGQLATRRLTGTAIATSSPLATRLAGGPHILHPGGGAPRWSSVTVEADSAALADGLSTALVLAPRDRIPAIAAALPGVTRITLVDAAGDLITL
ncbi:MAG: FAD:protein FMN transferase, partial [Rhodobacterales bacterium]|nr:FAD:protein FMN transferase [Rhodobacterales bacterium]